MVALVFVRAHLLGGEGVGDVVQVGQSCLQAWVPPSATSPSTLPFTPPPGLVQNRGDYMSHLPGNYSHYYKYC